MLSRGLPRMETKAYKRLHRIIHDQDPGSELQDIGHLESTLQYYLVMNTAAKSVADEPT